MADASKPDGPPIEKLTITVPAPLAGKSAEISTSDIKIDESGLVTVESVKWKTQSGASVKTFAKNGFYRCIMTIKSKTYRQIHRRTVE